MRRLRAGDCSPRAYGRWPFGLSGSASYSRAPPHKCGGEFPGFPSSASGTDLPGARGAVPRTRGIDERGTEGLIRYIRKAFVPGAARGLRPAALRAIRICLVRRCVATRPHCVPVGDDEIPPPPFVSIRRCLPAPGQSLARMPELFHAGSAVAILGLEHSCRGRAAPAA